MIANTNRIFVYHRIRLGLEALDNLASVYAKTDVKKPPDHILFHVPGNDLPHAQGRARPNAT